MSKRFTDTEKWKDPWFRKLTPVEKCVWIYLLDNCDNAGVWKKDFELMEFIIGEKIDIENLTGIRERIQDLGDKWWIKKFIEFQYGELSEDCKPHQSVILLLKKHSLYKGYTKGIYTYKDQAKEKDQAKAKEKDSEKRFKEIWNRYPRKENKKEALRHFHASVKTENDFIRITKAINNYLKYIDVQEIEYQFIKMGSTWFNNWEDYENFKIPEKKDKGLIQL